MPGPAPKHSSTRTRRNRSATAATLSAPSSRSKVPPLPELADQPWHPMTVSWWEDLWRSPMAPEFDPSDIHGLYLLAALVNGFWEHPSKELAAEIRLQRQCFGLSPIDRRRLQWEIERSDEAQDRGRRRRSTSSKPPSADPAADPRSVLRAV